MIGLKLTVKYLDGREVKTVAGPRDQVEFERHFNAAISDLAETQRTEWIYFLAWYPLYRQGLETSGFDEFLCKIDGINVEQTRERPTQPAAQDVGSLS